MKKVNLCLLLCVFLVGCLDQIQEQTKEIHIQSIVLREYKPFLGPVSCDLEIQDTNQKTYCFFALEQNDNLKKAQQLLSDVQKHNEIIRIRGTEAGRNSFAIREITGHNFSILKKDPPEGLDMDRATLIVHTF